MDDRFGAIVTTESTEDGGLMLLVEPISGANRLDGVRGRFSISIWREGARTIRMSLRTETSGATAYLQGGISLLALADDLGLVISR